MRAALRVPAVVVWLTVLWLALWGSVSWANVVSGLLVAAVVLVVARIDPASLRPTYFRPLWAIWYVVYLAYELFVSNLRLAREILTPGSRTHTGIIAVPMRGGSDAVVTLVANSITLTPGTMTVDVHQRDGGVVLYVHSMFAHDVESVRHDVLRLEALALRAFGSPSDYERSLADIVEHERLLPEPSDRGGRGERGGRAHRADPPSPGGPPPRGSS